jgi:hypothetical protein
MRSPPCTVEKLSLPDITLPPPTESDENIMDQILPDSSRADNNYALEELTQAVLIGNELQKQMLEIHGKMLTELRRTTDQLEKVEVAIRRQESSPLICSNLESPSFPETTTKVPFANSGTYQGQVCDSPQIRISTTQEE